MTFYPAPKISNCPHCDAPNNAWSSSDNVPVEPVPGVPSLCFHCGGLSVYNYDLTLRKATAEEEAIVAANPAVDVARRAISYTDSPHLARTFIDLMQ